MPWLAVAATAVIGLAILFCGAISDYFAGAAFAALVLFIIPIAVPGPAAAIPARLEGWALAATVGTCALMPMWPRRPGDARRESPGAAGRKQAARRPLRFAPASGEPLGSPRRFS
jgi:hypothetical protein